MQSLFQNLNANRIVPILRQQIERLGSPNIRGNSRSVLPSSKGFVLFVVAVFLTVAILIAFFDASISLWAEGFSSQNVFMRGTFRVITTLGSSGWIIVICLFLMILFAAVDWQAQNNRHKVIGRLRGEVATYIFSSVAVSGTLVSLLKNSIGRARPRHLETLGPHYFDFAAFESSFASFPSGHSTTFGALSMALALAFPKLRWFMLATGVIGGISRIMVGAHFASDVVAGLFLGALFALGLARWLANRGVVFTVESQIFPKPRLKFWRKTVR